MTHEELVERMRTVAAKHWGVHSDAVHGGRKLMLTLAAEVGAACAEECEGSDNPHYAADRIRALTGAKQEDGR